MDSFSRSSSDIVGCTSVLRVWGNPFFPCTWHWYQECSARYQSLYWQSGASPVEGCLGGEEAGARFVKGEVKGAGFG